MTNPRQNRITPKGELVADPSRGLFMGNRGILHDADGSIGHRTWRHKNWIICRTEFKGRKRPLMAPNRYTELFFLDEATALAAGHRPCWECRRDAYTAYREALHRCGRVPVNASAGELDRMLHDERAVSRTFRQKTWTAPLSDLPDGTMIEAESRFLLVAGDHLLEWSLQGYRIACDRARFTSGQATVLTPRTSVSALAAGFEPVVHPTANSSSGPVFSKTSGQSY